jgi:hypothetical protein
MILGESRAGDDPDLAPPSNLTRPSMDGSIYCDRTLPAARPALRVGFAVHVGVHEGKLKGKHEHDVTILRGVGRCQNGLRQRQPIPAPILQILPSLS